MRVTGGRMIDLAATASSGGRAEVAQAASEVSSGLRVAKPSDDPAAWLAAERAGLRKTLTAGASTAVAISRDRLDDTDAALATIGESVSLIRMLAVQGANASYNDSDRAGIAVQVRALFGSALSAANTKAPDGEYLLAGSASLTEPFTATGAYVGDAAERVVPTGDALGSTVSTLAGSALTAARGVDVLPLFQRVATALETNDMAGLEAMLGELDTAIKQVALSRTHVGSAMGVLDQTKVAHTQLQQSLATEISRNVEADAIAAATNLAKTSQMLEASRTVTAHIVKLVQPSRA